MPVSLAWRRLIVVATVALATLARPAEPSQSTAPPLPTLALESYPADAREAIGAAYQQARQRPDDSDVVGRLALLLHAWEQLDPAAQAYARAQALAPRDVAWWYLAGLAATRQALPSEAARHFAEAQKVAPEVPLVRLRLADAKLAEGALSDAAALYSALVTVPECAPSAWYGLGRIHVSQGEQDEARRAFEQALTLYPEFGAAHYALAQLQRRAGAAAAARLSLARQQQCLACWPVPQDPWRERLDAVRDDAGALLARGVSTAAARTAAADAEAIRLHEAALAKDPSRGQAHVNLIELYGRTGNITAAERHYRAAAALPGLAAEAHRTFGMVLLSQQKAADALPLFRQAAAIVPNDIAVLQGLGLTHELLNQAEEAAAAYLRALDLSPTLRPARFNLARVYMRQQRVDAAIVHLEQLRRPEDADAARYVFALAVAHVRNGNVTDGARVAREALDLARRFGQTELATAIEAEMRKLEPA